MHPGVPLVQELRSGRVQALHTGHGALLDPTGGVLESWGDPDAATYWRSAPKPLQALPFIEVMDGLGFSDEDLALACASHSGEPSHVARAEAMLERSGLDASALRCGGHPPMTRHAAEEDGDRVALRNNCSGKHAAMLAVCVHHGWPTATYQDPEHPLQRRIRDLVSQATGAAEVPVGVDGCGVPTFWLPLAALGRAYQWLDRDPRGRRALDAMAAHPEWVGGTDRFCTQLMRAGGGDLVGKVGAAGVYVVLHRPSGKALVVKTADGSGLAAETWTALRVRDLGWVAPDALAPFAQRPVTDCRGNLVGAWEAA